jgi:soluble lytic murein transglycosylase-like protein
MPSRDELIALAKAEAAAQGLDPTLVCAVCEQESSWYPWAMRYEPAFYERYVRPLGLSPTESTLRSFSFGLMQIMGQTARELGFKARSLGELLDPSQCVHYGCLKLAACLRLADGDVQAGLLKYNGGSNPDYPSQVMARMASYPPGT